jgi:hypothetical protein
VRLNTWGDDAAILDGAAMCWIAFPADKNLVESGTFGVGRWEEKEEVEEADNDDENEEETGLRKWKNDDGEKVRGRRGRVKFKKNWFPRVPTVVVALNMLDMGGNSDLRIRTVVEDVSREGFSWRIETWVRYDLSSLHSSILTYGQGNSKLYAAGVSWIALGFE